MTKTEQIIKLAQDAHASKYSYDLVNFTGMTHKIEVFCEDHGSFWVTPTAHINHLVGCPICAEAPVATVETIEEEPEVVEEEPEVVEEEPEVVEEEPISYFKKRK